MIQIIQYICHLPEVLHASYYLLFAKSIYTAIVAFCKAVKYVYFYVFVSSLDVKWEKKKVLLLCFCLYNIEKEPNKKTDGSFKIQNFGLINFYVRKL